MISATIEINSPRHLDEEVHKRVDQCQLVWISFKGLQFSDLWGKARGGGDDVQRA